jgi:SAM-dependent methyltransferase
MKWLGENYEYEPRLGIWLSRNRAAFDYSDGDEVETRIENIIETSFDRSSSSLELQKRITDWPSQYHLDARRSNLLKPVRHLLKGRVLEIGAGTGALTRYLGECGAQVVAVEGSTRRASIAAKRCGELKDVCLVADNIFKVPQLAEFDVVTLIGVLEYARKYFRDAGGDPINDLISHAANYLRPGGVLIIAIENQLGLKYLAGAPEDHFGIPMLGIEDRYTANSAVTFGRKELAERLMAAGLEHQQWWFPFPDYKLPISVVSENTSKYAVDLSALVGESVQYDPQVSQPLAFSLERAWRPVFRNGLLGELANSFLVLCSKAELPSNNVLAVHYGMPRRPEFNKEVKFVWRNGRAEVLRSRMKENAAGQRGRTISMHLEDEVFSAGPTWQNQLQELLTSEGWRLEDWVRWARTWFDALLRRADIPILPVPSPGTSVSGDLADAIPRNLIVAEGGDSVFFDQEWRFSEPIDLGFLVYRALNISLFSVKESTTPKDGSGTGRYLLYQAFVSSLGWDVTTETLAGYKAKEDAIQQEVADVSTLPLVEFYKPIPSRISFVDMRSDQIAALRAQYDALATKNHISHFEALRHLGAAEDIKGQLEALISEMRQARE